MHTLLAFLAAAAFSLASAGVNAQSSASTVFEAQGPIRWRGFGTAQTVGQLIAAADQVPEIGSERTLDATREDGIVSSYYLSLGDCRGVTRLQARNCVSAEVRLEPKDDDALASGDVDGYVSSRVTLTLVFSASLRGDVVVEALRSAWGIVQIPGADVIFSGQRGLTAIHGDISGSVECTPMYVDLAGGGRERRAERCTIRINEFGLSEAAGERIHRAREAIRAGRSGNARRLLRFE